MARNVDNGVGNNADGECMYEAAACHSFRHFDFRVACMTCFKIYAPLLAGALLASSKMDMRLVDERKIYIKRGIDF